MVIKLKATVEEIQEGTIGICHSCGEKQDGCEPDAREYICESCGKPRVYGLEETLVMACLTWRMESMLIPMTTETFMAMDLNQLRAWWLYDYLDKSAEVADFNSLHKALVSFDLTGRQAVCQQLGTIDYKRNLELDPYDKHITVQELAVLLYGMKDTHDYRRFSVEFFKKDDTYRKMHCHFGLPDGTVPVGKKTFDDKAKGLCTVFDVVSQDFRSFTIGKVVRADINGTKYYVKENESLLSKLPVETVSI